MEPEIRYTHAADGVAIAYTVVGEGPPLLFDRGILTPGLDDEIGGPSRFWSALKESHSVVLWDIRGVGLSGSAPEAGFDDWLADVEAVADAAGADRFDFVGTGSGCHIAMAYAARQPDRVKRVVLYRPSRPGFSVRRDQPWLFARAAEDWHDFVEMLAFREHGWDRVDVAQRWADRLRAHFTSEQFLHLMDLIESIDTSRDAGSINAPTLVIDDRATPMFPAARAVALQRFAPQLAAAIPGAQLAIIKPGDAPAAQVVKRFLSGSSAAAESLEVPAASGTAVILFTDIVASTALTERMGDAAFRDASRTLDDQLRTAIRDAGGTPIEGKVLGDGVMATFPSASQAIDGARACVGSANATQLQLHLGIHAGDVIHEPDNVYGGAVNIASRICGLSAPGEILVSDVVRGMARSSAGVEFDDRGDHEMKGVGDAVRVYAVRSAVEEPPAETA